MANEAVLRQWLENPIDFTCADGTGIEKGAVLTLTDPRTAVISTTDGGAVAGICAREKIASDGRTQVAVYRKGIFDMVCSQAVTIGSPVMSYASTGASNTIGMAVGAAVSGASIIGYALEAGALNEVIQVLVDIGGGSSI